MRLTDVMPATGVTRVIDICPDGVDIRRHLRLAEDVDYQRPPFLEAVGDDFGPGLVVVSLLGPRTSPPATSAPASYLHTDPDALAPILKRFRPGTRGLFILAWPLNRLPLHKLVAPLADARCQIIAAVPIKQPAMRDVGAALVVECVERLQHIKPYLADAQRTSPDSAIPTFESSHSVGDGKSPGVAELPTVLRLANEYVLSDLAARAVRLRLQELAKQVEELDQALTKARAVENSITFQVGQAMVAGARRPARAIYTVPRDLIKIWKERQTRRRASDQVPPLR